MQSILVLDDNVAYADILERVLSDKGYAVEVFHGAREALASLEGGTTYTVILTDLSVPELGGTNLVEHLRSAAPQTPIIVMSGFYYPTLLEELTIAGATDAIAKPFRFPELLAKINEVLSFRRPGNSSGHGAAKP